MQQQLVDEKVQSQNLMADAKAANRRAEKLPKLEIENEEYRSRVRQLERDVAEKIDSTQGGVGQLREGLEMVKGELEVERGRISDAGNSPESDEELTAVSGERDMLINEVWGRSLFSK